MIDEKIKSYSKVNVFFAVLFWFCVVFCVLMIFFFSQQPGEESSSTSETILKYINTIFKGIFTEDIVRKIAHVLEFTLLSLFTYLAIYHTNKISVETSYSESRIKLMKSDNEMCIIFTTWFCILNAVIDEYHQLFISGRAGSIVDVGIDLIGVIILMLVFRLTFSLSLKIKGKTEVRYN